VGSEQIIAALPKPVQRIRSLEPVEVADAPAPIREVDVVLGPAVSQRFSTAWAAGSRSGAGLDADDAEPPSPCPGF
jgi:hypothetical protein